MARWLAQLTALLQFNLRTIPSRKGSAAAALFGIAGVVGVLVGVLSIAHGFRQAMVASGSPDMAVILRAGSDAEMMSILSREEARLIEGAPGIATASGKALVSPELFVVVNLPKRSTGTDANVPMRGIEPAGLAVHREVKLVEGRMFGWGKNEIIAGRGARLEFSGLDVGSQLRFGQSKWTVVGIFEAGGGIAESELWADAAVLGPAYQRGTSFQVAVARLASAGKFQEFKDALTSDPRLNVKVTRETDYYASQSRLLVLLITGLGSIISGLMAVGAVFGALNTMYTAVSSRAREMATLRALGFGTSAVMASILVESLLLSLAGGVLGAVVAWAFFDGYRAATMNWQSFSQVAFAFAVTPALLTEGIVYALVIGLIGGLLPAIRAARMPVSDALRRG